MKCLVCFGITSMKEDTSAQSFLPFFLNHKSRFFKATRVVTLGPVKFTPTTQGIGGIFLHGGITEIIYALHAFFLRG